MSKEKKLFGPVSVTEKDIEELKKENIFEAVFVTRSAEELKKELKTFTANSPRFRNIDSIGNNVLHDIALAHPRHRLFQYIKSLIEARVDIDKINNPGFSPIFYAIYGQHFENLKALYECKADIITFGKGVHILDYAAGVRLAEKQYKWLENIFINKYPENIFVHYSGIKDEKSYLNKIKSIARKISNVDVKPHPFQCTALCQAAYKGSFPAVKYLLEKRANPFLTNEQGYNSLFVAIQNSHIDIVKFLHSQNHNLISSTMELKGDSVLHTAAAIGDKEMISLLLEKQAYIYGLNKEGKPPLVVAIEHNHVETSKALMEKTNLEDSIILSYFCLDACLKIQNLYLFHQLLQTKGINLYNFDVMLLIVSDKKNDYTQSVTIKAVKHIYQNIDLNIRNLKYKMYPLEILILANYIPTQDTLFFLKWFFNQKLHERLTTAAIISAFKSVQTKKGEDIKIAALCKKHLFPKLTPLQQFFVAKEAFKINKFKIMNLYMPEINILFNLPLSVHYNFTRADIINILHLLFLLWKSGDGVFVLDKKFATKLYLALTLGFSQYFLESKNTGRRLSTILRAASTRWENPQIPRFISQSAFSFLREKHPLTEVKSMIYEAKHPKQQLFSTSLTFYGPALPPPCHWFDGTLSSDDPRLIPMEGESTPNSRVLIPPFLLEDSSAREILNKSRWHFEKKNGLQRIVGNYLRVTLTIVIDQKPIPLATQYSSELKSSGKDRILCIQVDSPDRGKLIIPVYYAKDGLHKGHPNISENLPPIQIPPAVEFPKLQH